MTCRRRESIPRLERDGERADDDADVEEEVGGHSSEGSSTGDAPHNRRRKKQRQVGGNKEGGKAKKKPTTWHQVKCVVEKKTSRREACISAKTPTRFFGKAAEADALAEQLFPHLGGYLAGLALSILVCLVVSLRRKKDDNKMMHRFFRVIQSKSALRLEKGG